MIQINKLHKYYNKGKENEIHVINDTTLSLPETGFVCILGESGSGKTTLLNTIGGLDDYASGAYTIDDVTLKSYSKEKMDRLRTEHFAYVFQNYYLLMNLKNDNIFELKIPSVPYSNQISFVTKPL